MANEIFATILQNQNQYIREGEAARVALDAKVTEALNQFNDLANREYGYTHDAIVTDDLENDYNLIINGGYQRLYNPPIDWETEYASYYYLDGSNYVLNNSAMWDWDKEYYNLLEPHYYYIEVNAQPDDWESTFNTYYLLIDDQYVLKK